MANQGGTQQQGKAGQQGQKNSGNKNGNDTHQSSAKGDAKQGGTHEQHVKAGQQSNKNDR